MNTKPNSPLERLKHHVTGAIERGEKSAIVVEPPTKPIYEVIDDITCEDCGTGYGEDGPLVKVAHNVPGNEDCELHDLCRECLEARIGELPFMLSGDHDEDVFLTEDDMSEEHWEFLMGCYHSGACDDDVAEASKHFTIEEYGKAVKHLIACGIERERFFNSAQELDKPGVLAYYLWTLSADIQERATEEENADV